MIMINLRKTTTTEYDIMNSQELVELAQVVALEEETRVTSVILTTGDGAEYEVHSNGGRFFIIALSVESEKAPSVRTAKEVLSCIATGF